MFVGRMIAGHSRHSSLLHLIECVNHLPIYIDG
jgi:hypothetical protein